MKIDYFMFSWDKCLQNVSRFVWDSIFEYQEDIFVKFGILLSSDVSYLNRKWNYRIDVKKMSIFNDDLVSIWNSKKLLYRVSEFSNVKVVVIMIIIDNVISPTEKFTKTTEIQLTFDFIKESLYENPMRLMVLWW